MSRLASRLVGGIVGFGESEKRGWISCTVMIELVRVDHQSFRIWNNSRTCNLLVLDGLLGSV